MTYVINVVSASITRPEQSRSRARSQLAIRGICYAPRSALGIITRLMKQTALRRLALSDEKRRHVSSQSGDC
jgi:hypothetical protein